jgi:ABC-type branched-subunit amino acid transport system ATPase component
MKSIKVKRLSKSFGEVTAVKDARCKILPGRVTGFLGPNGAGKTTLFHLISGDLIPDAGDITLFDEDNGQSIDLVHLQRHRMAALGIGKLYQDIKIFDHLSVLDNVVVGLFTDKEKSPFWIFSHLVGGKRTIREYEEKAIAALEFVGLSQELGQDIYYKSARELSYGQQKLLSFARLMGRDFDILLLDEPTAGVNEFLVKKLETFIKEMARAGKTVAVIEHNVKVLEKVADFIYFMEDGRIEFFGKADHILNNQEVRQRYIGME